jgi:rhodanese-related sulfurtransferase
MADEILAADGALSELEERAGPGAAADPDGAAALERARQAAKERGLAYAGGVEPRQAWGLVSSGAATLLDVRSAEERKFVGHVPDSQHVAWATGTALTRNPRFVREVEAKFKDKNAVLLLLCRSGRRSAAAAEALSKAGFSNAFNVLEGFEGEIDARQHRGVENGWRFRGLPWVQD